MARKKRERVDTSPGGAGGLGGLGALLQASGLEGSAEPAAEPAVAAGAQPGKPRKLGKVVLRREKKGRGGKVVTTLTRHGLSEADCKAMAKRLRKALGCGAGVEGDVVVLQGDQRDRAVGVLEGEGWRVVRG
jgi:translation initiation factor 1